MPTAAGGCDAGKPACRGLALTEGSVLGGGGNPPVSGPNLNWPNISLSNYQSEVVNGNFGILVPQPGTGAKNLSLPFVNGATHPFEIIRRPRPTDSSGLSESREYNMAQIRVLLSDDPAELPGGAGDANNVRLANVAGSNQYGIATPVAPAAFPGNVIPVLGAGQTYNTYFATATAAVPDASSCNGVACTPASADVTLNPDWPMAPKAAPAGAQTLVPVGAPNLTAGLVPPAVVALCPPTDVAPSNLPAGCPATTAAPYYSPANAAGAATWNLLDGYLRVEYKNSLGVWVGVTNEWLGLGFARGFLPPTAPGGNSIHPNAILILQEPGDRNGNGAIDTAGIAPVCTVHNSSGVCTNWTNPLPPEGLTDFMMTGAGTKSPFVGVTSAGTVTQSFSKNNWYPINFYDTREGEPRDVNAGNGTCSTAGVMNAVEIDVGNLKRWLWGQIGVNGPNVDFLAQNGWVLYFSDRRGMLPNPNAPYLGEKSGDSGLEDSINTGSAAGVPDGNLEPLAAGTKFSPEDVNQNKALDSFGPANMGLGFYNANNANSNLNFNITNAAPANPYLRINSCVITARKNWVSGARHVVKLIDGGFGNVPYRQDGTLASPGGFTVASENPVYVQGDYNSNAADTIWTPPPPPPPDLAGHAAASVIADSVTLLSNSWSDLNSFVNSTVQTNRNATTTYYRLAIAGGKNMNFPRPAFGGNDYGTDGGVHNFLRYLEDWSGQTLNYKGSLVSLYYSTYLTGVFK
jgi:hypothetical protein